MNARESQAGWYADPLQPGRLRYFDGSRWTDQVHAAIDSDHLPWTEGWFPDPLDQTRSRLFDGTEWSEQVRSGSPPDFSRPDALGGLDEAHQAPRETADPASSEARTVPSESIPLNEETQSPVSVPSPAPTPIFNRLQEIWERSDATMRAGAVIAGGVMAAALVAVMVSLAATGVAGSDAAGPGASAASPCGEYTSSVKNISDKALDQLYSGEVASNLANSGMSITDWETGESATYGQFLEYVWSRAFRQSRIQAVRYEGFEVAINRGWLGSWLRRNLPKPLYSEVYEDLYLLEKCLLDKS